MTFVFIKHYHTLPSEANFSAFIYMQDWIYIQEIKYNWEGKEQWMMTVMTGAKQVFEAAEHLKSRTSPKTACSLKRIKWLLLG